MLQTTYFLLIFLLIFLLSPIAQAKPPVLQKTCRLSYLTKSDLSTFRAKGSPVGTLSHSVNEVLKSSFSFANLVDKYTLGLASAVSLGMLLNTTASFEDIKPDQWNKIRFTGSLIYKDTPFTVMPVRGAKIKIMSDKKTETLTSGSNGEFSFPFYKLVSYTRFRLFPFIMFERKTKIVKTLKIPIQIEITSKVCNGKIKIVDLPLEPITFILAQEDPS